MRLRREVSAAAPDSVVVQSILVQTQVPILRQMALGMQIALSTLPSLERLFHMASAHVRCVGKNLSLVLIAEGNGVVPVHAMRHRLDASVVQALVNHRFHMVDWTLLTFMVLGWRNRTSFGAGDPLKEWQDVETIGLVIDVVKRVERFLGCRGPLLPSGGHGLLTNSLSAGFSMMSSHVTAALNVVDSLRPGWYEAGRVFVEAFLRASSECHSPVILSTQSLEHRPPHMIPLGDACWTLLREKTSDTEAVRS